MRRSLYIRALLFLVFSLSISDAFAYCYTAFEGSVSKQSSTSGPDACKALIASKGVPTNGTSGGSSGGACYYYSPGGTYFTLGQWARTGTPSGTCANPNVCDTGQTWNGTVCVADNPCTSKTGTNKRFSKAGSFNDGYYTSSNGFGSASQSGCSGGCAASTADQKCTGSLKTSTYVCRGIMYFSGTECITSPAPDVDDSLDTSRPSPQSYEDTKPCVYTTNANGEQVCSSSKSKGKEGQSCSNGSCPSTKPTQTETKITTSVKDSFNPDGSSSSTKTDTANTTKCTGIGQCTTTSTTTTTTTTKDANGNVTSTTGTCTGPQCPDKNTNPDGDGDGLGDCTSENCGDGDGGELVAPELEDVDDYQETTQKFFNRAKSAPLLSAVGNIQAPTGGTAPDFTSDPIAALGGESLDLSLIAQLKPIIANILSLVMKAAWCFIALVIFLAA